MLKKFRKFGLPVVFGTALALLTPAFTYARDYDRDDYYRHYRHHHRHYRAGYYDRYGYWHPYDYR